MNAGPFREHDLAGWGRQLGEALARRPEGTFIALRGDLGAGKSVLARAIAHGAGVDAAMPSPTFNLVFRYHADGHTVAHLDLYRLESADDVWELGWEELSGGEEIALVEWPERAESLLPRDRLEIALTTGPADDERTLEMRAVGRVELPELPAAS